MNLRDEIAKIIETESAYGYYAHDRAIELADRILALIEGQRCEWTKCLEDGNEYYITSCDMVDTAYHTYCPKCGRKIVVKEKEDE